MSGFLFDCITDGDSIFFASDWFRNEYENLVNFGLGEDSYRFLGNNGYFFFVLME